MPFKAYLAELRKNLRSRRATEATYYPALQRLLEQLSPEVNVFTEAQHINV